MKLEGNICVFGDSIVWGAWDKEKAGWEKNIKKIIDICKMYTGNIMFVGLTKVNENYTVPISWNDNEMYFNKTIERYNNKIEECCSKNKISFLDVFEILGDEDLNIDGIHPNEIGHKKLFKHFCDTN